MQTIRSIEKAAAEGEERSIPQYPHREATTSSSTITRLFNDYSGAESHNPHKTHETPPQNCSAAGFAYVLKQPKSLISSGFRA